MRHAAPLAVVLLLIVLPPAAAPAATPAQPPLTLELEELWRAGGDQDELLIGLPVEAVADGEGRVYLADQQLCRVDVFGPDGTFEGTLSREGEGPGEVRGPVDLVLLPDGTVGIAEIFPGKLVKVTRDDLPAGEITIDVSRGQTGGFTVQTMADAAGEHLLVAGSRSVPKDRVLERTHFLAMIDHEGREIARFAEQVAEIQRPHSVVHEDDFLPCFPLASTLGPDGRVYAPRRRDHYEVSVFRPDGTLERVIERPGFVTWPRTDRDTNRVLTLFHAWASPNPETWPEFDLEDTERAIAALHVDGRGRLWVQHSRSNRDQPDGIFLTMDVYDPAGRWLREVSLACEGNPISDGVRFLRDGRVLLIKGFVLARLACLGGAMATFGEDDADTVEIVCYRLPEFD